MSLDGTSINAATNSINQFDTINALITRIGTDGAKEDQLALRADISTTREKVKSLLASYGGVTSVKESLDEVNTKLSEIENKFSTNPKDKEVFKSLDIFVKHIPFLKAEVVNKEAMGLKDENDRDTLFYDMANKFIDKGDLDSAKALYQKMTPCGVKDVLGTQLINAFNGKGDTDSISEIIYDQVTQLINDKNLERAEEYYEGMPSGGLKNEVGVQLVKAFVANGDSAKAEAISKKIGKQ